MSKGQNHLRKNAIGFLKRKVEGLKMGHRPRTAIEEVERQIDVIHDKLKRRGEWKYKTKRELSAAQSRSKSKKGKTGGKSGKAKKGEED